MVLLITLLKFIQMHSIDNIHKEIKMTIITLKNIQTGEKFRVLSIIEPIINTITEGNNKIIPKIRWLYEDTQIDVDIEFHNILNQQKLKRFIGRDYIIDKVE